MLFWSHWDRCSGSFLVCQCTDQDCIYQGSQCIHYGLKKEENKQIYKSNEVKWPNLTRQLYLVRSVQGLKWYSLFISVAHDGTIISDPIKWKSPFCIVTLHPSMNCLDIFVICMSKLHFMHFHIKIILYSLWNTKMSCVSINSDSPALSAL